MKMSDSPPPPKRQDMNATRVAPPGGGTGGVTVVPPCTVKMGPSLGRAYCERLTVTAAGAAGNGATGSVLVRTTLGSMG